MHLQIRPVTHQLPCSVVECPIVSLLVVPDEAAAWIGIAPRLTRRERSTDSEMLLIAIDTAHVPTRQIDDLMTDILKANQLWTRTFVHRHNPYRVVGCMGGGGVLLAVIE